MIVYDTSDNFQMIRLSESNSFRSIQICSIQTINYDYNTEIEVFDSFFQVNDSTF